KPTSRSSRSSSIHSSTGSGSGSPSSSSAPRSHLSPRSNRVPQLRPRPYPGPMPQSAAKSSMRKRLLHITLLCLLAVPMLGAGAPSSRFNALGHKLMCVCGCGQVLLECNHVGCPDSDRMITELRTEIATGLPDSGVLNWFVGKYGPTVLAAPLRGGFDIVAWIVPFAALFLGIA